jgi:2-oxoglutarate ferredoxin oxidoreductase subunit gamma
MKQDKLQLRLAGAGGQGVILGSIILAEATLSTGKQVVQSQSYGAEARGGLCKAEVIVDREPIDYSKVDQADFLLALTQESLNKYAPEVSGQGIIMADESLKIPAHLHTEKVVRVPILKTAREVVGKAVTANIVAVGAINSLLGLAAEQALEEAVLRHVPRQTATLNSRALRAGIKLIKNGNRLKRREKISA